VSRRAPHHLAVLTLVLALGLTAVAGSAAGALDRWLGPPGDGEVLTLLLLGSDEGPPRSGRLDEGNADGFQLLFVSGDRQHATIVSVPRDSFVPVPNQGRTRINACLFHGPERCVDAAESVFGVTVDGYLLTSMRAFTRGVERFGGIEVDVPQNLRVGGTRVAPGTQTLDGPEALVYARDRKSRSDGDIGRSRAQAQLLAAAHRQVRDDASPGGILRALSILRRHTVTDLSGPELTRLAFESLQLPPSNVERVHLPGSLGFAGPAHVYFLSDAAYAIVSDAADDGRLS
jgi:polyisoprenyl-teichoic acid--peptidoglycan teichoic acid transferase